MGHPGCLPTLLCCCPRATPHPQELVACAVAPGWPKPTPSTLRRVYCWHEHSDLSGQGSPALGGEGILGTRDRHGVQELMAAPFPLPAPLPPPSTVPGTLVPWAGLSHRNAPLMLQWPKAFGIPAEAGGTHLAPSPAASQKLAPDPAAPRGPGHRGRLLRRAGGRSHRARDWVKAGEAARGKRNLTALAQPEPARRVQRICAKTKLKG